MCIESLKMKPGNFNFVSLYKMCKEKKMRRPRKNKIVPFLKINK